MYLSNKIHYFANTMAELHDTQMRLLMTDSPWYAIRLFTTRQGEVKSYFEEQGFECFIPMQYVGAEGHDGRTHRTLRPVVNNLIFVKQSDEETTFRRVVQQADYKISVLRKAKDSREYSLIPHRQMYEFG